MREHVDVDGFGAVCELNAGPRVKEVAGAGVRQLVGTRSRSSMKSGRKRGVCGLEGCGVV
jgi:hypothetical protein